MYAKPTSPNAPKITHSPFRVALGVKIGSKAHDHRNNFCLAPPSGPGDSRMRGVTRLKRTQLHHAAYVAKRNWYGYTLSSVETLNVQNHGQGKFGVIPVVDTRNGANK